MPAYVSSLYVGTSRKPLYCVIMSKGTAGGELQGQYARALTVFVVSKS